MTEQGEDGGIRTAPCPKCSVCGSGGAYVHRDLPDRLFGAPGSWNLRKCSNASCGLMWLDPMPLTEDIGKAYLNYYTHRAVEGARAPGGLKRLYRLMKRSYWASQYNYPTTLDGFRTGCLAGFLRLFPIRRGDVDAEVRFLPAVPNGDLLDVGCGSGEWLRLMGELGWRVHGVDFDAKAVALAREEASDVRVGSLEEQGYPDAAFDAVTLNHVIEHVPDPLATLTECARVLKPGGRVVVATPNNESLGHRWFKQGWRGLEPPRHLHIFSPDSLREVLTQAGCRDIVIHQQIATSVTYESALLWRQDRDRRTLLSSAIPPAVFARLFSLWEWLLPKNNPVLGDCMTALAVKE